MCRAPSPAPQNPINPAPSPLRMAGFPALAPASAPFPFADPRLDQGCDITMYPSPGFSASQRSAASDPWASLSRASAPSASLLAAEPGRQVSGSTRTVLKPSRRQVLHNAARLLLAEMDSSCSSQEASDDERNYLKRPRENVASTLDAPARRSTLHAPKNVASTQSAPARPSKRMRKLAGVAEALLEQMQQELTSAPHGSSPTTSSPAKSQPSSSNTASLATSAGGEEVSCRRRYLREAAKLLLQEMEQAQRHRHLEGQRGEQTSPEHSQQQGPGRRRAQQHPHGLSSCAAPNGVHWSESERHCRSHCQLAGDMGPTDDSEAAVLSRALQDGQRGGQRAACDWSRTSITEQTKAASTVEASSEWPKLFGVRLIPQSAVL